MRPIALSFLSNYLSSHIWIIKNGVRMCPCDQFYCRLVLEGRGRLEFKLDQSSSFCWASLLVIYTSMLPSTSLWSSLMFLRNITSLGSNLFSIIWKGSLKNSSPLNLIGTFELGSLDHAYWLEDQRVYPKEWCPHQVRSPRRNYISRDEMFYCMLLR